MLDLTGKVAIVTGAGSVGPGWGNGKATAVLFARQGAAVFCIDNKPEAVAETVGIIAKEGGRAVAHTADVTDSDAVKASIEAAVATFGRLDILVNNVGGSAPGSAESMTEEVWDRQFDINLRSVFLGCKHALPYLRECETAAIVNIASIAALRMSGDRPHIAYSASKMGVIGLTKSVAMDQARKGVRCNVVIPGLMHTPLVENRLLRQLGANDAASLVAKRDAQVPTGKMGTGWDVAHAVLFLAADESRYITGTEIIVDGGMSAMMPGAGA
ncbi:SDR family NAD(P)-dependent oxidoreductase [Neoroseomonas alba]|uniref:SDR family NAD(P)-dependent oxidoreductase n=1 Tax=Roseomonas alba TaxID=2846776 RepID=UPI0034E270BA